MRLISADRCVSTHSRPKAAGKSLHRFQTTKKGFNTQPPEGGWLKKIERQETIVVSTHSRPKAAGYLNATTTRTKGCFNTQPPEGGWRIPTFGLLILSDVSTHSRPKAAGFSRKAKIAEIYGFNTQPPEGGWTVPASNPRSFLLFQHTAARRRLACRIVDFGKFFAFQHTAARRRLDTFSSHRKPFICFNTQPPEGGWPNMLIQEYLHNSFQHTAARRRLARWYRR